MLLLLALACSGCTHRAKWLHGKWAFDREHTEQVLSEQSKKEGSDGRSLLEGLKDLAAGLVVPQLTATLEGTRIEFTDKELIATDKAGNGKAVAYEVIEVPDESTIRIKQADGEVTTYHREGDRFWRSASGSTQFRVYFRRLKE